MKVFSLPVLILLLMLLTSCGKTASGNKKIVTITPAQISHLMENQLFECASLDGGICPEGIARVFVLNIKDPSQTELCSGFLASSNRLVTNHHCLSLQEQCENTYVSVFNGNTFEVAKCQTIISAEYDGKPLKDKGVDYSVVELDRHIRTASVFEMAKFVPKIGDKLTAWVVDHVDLFTGRITELSCTLSNRSNSFELENCPAIAGNSGSPIVNERGQVVGILWGSAISDYVNEETSLEERRKLNNYSYATELKHFQSALLSEIKKVIHASY
jgi:V8-like Glu-specific endopeptidase